MGGKLNLKWIKDVIGDDYKNWRNGEIVLLQAQTGTGKTHFVKNVLIDKMEEWERMLLVCNRTNLKRQLKRDLLEKNNMEIPKTLKELDEITTIGNVVITSYHALQYAAIDELYDGQTFDLSKFKYIILDECHYIFSDGNFNNKTKFAFSKLIQNHHHQSITMFISATLEELKQPIIRNHAKGYFGKTPKIHEYKTGTDYSYCNVKYFRKILDIVDLIKNDKSDEKWLVFVTNLEMASTINEELTNCSIVKAGTKSEELNNIINDSKFENKILIATKAIDNGINIFDDKLKNIVIMAWDRISFIQMLGRKRVNIENADKVDLYIPTRYKKSFYGKIKEYDKKFKVIKLWETDPNGFDKKYNDSLDKLGKYNDIFYRDKETKDFKVNPIGLYRLIEDKEFAENMVNRFEKQGEFAFVKQQLEWLGLQDTFDEIKLVQDIVLNENIEKLEQYLESIVGKTMLGTKDRMELIEKIGLVDTHNSNVKKNKIVLLKKINTLNSYLNEINNNYIIKEFETSRTIDNKKKNYKSAWKVMRII